MNYDFLETDPEKSLNVSNQNSFLLPQAAPPEAPKLDVSNSFNFSTPNQSLSRSLNLNQRNSLSNINSTTAQNLFYTNLNNGSSTFSSINLTRPINTRAFSAFNKQPFSLNTPTPTLVRIGLKSTGSSQLNNNTVKTPLPPAQRSFPPVQYLPEDVTPAAKRLRISLINQQRRVTAPLIKFFHSENDIVSNLSTYHLYDGEPFPSDDELEKDDNNYRNLLISLSDRTNSIIKKYNYIVIPKKRKYSDEIQIFKHFISQERTKLTNDIRYYKSNVQQYIAPPTPTPPPKTANDEMDFFTRSDIFGFSNSSKLF